MDREKNDTQEDFVDPWNVTSSSDAGVDYDKLISNIWLSTQSPITRARTPLRSLYKGVAHPPARIFF